MSVMMRPNSSIAKTSVSFRSCRDSLDRVRVGPRMSPWKLVWWKTRGSVDSYTVRDCVNPLAELVATLLPSSTVVQAPVVALRLIPRSGPDAAMTLRHGRTTLVTRAEPLCPLPCRSVSYRPVRGVHPAATPVGGGCHAHDELRRAMLGAGPTTHGERIRTDLY